MCWVTQQIDSYLSRIDREEAAEIAAEEAANQDGFAEYLGEAVESLTEQDVSPKDWQHLIDTGTFEGLSASGREVALKLAEELAETERYQAYRK